MPTHATSRRPLLLVLCALAGGACAQTYPAKQVRFIIPYAAGGTTDVLARILADRAAPLLGQTLLIDFRPGAGGTIGADVAAKAPADGYTILMGAPGTHSTAVSLYPNLPYNPARDFQPVVHVANVANVVVVHPSLPVQSVADLVRLAKARPGDILYGSAGIGATTHLSGELFNLTAGTKLTHVPYKGSSQAMIDLLGGQIQMMFENLPGATGYIKSGKLRGLAVTSARPSSALPELPTVAQTLPGFEVVAWFGVFAPTGTPAAAMARLNNDMDRALKMPELRERYTQVGAEAIGGSPADLGKFAADDLAKWTRVIKQAGIKVQ
jgi:tripartite-type tricarboxylate transporter receptor subunit TctC